MDRTRGRTMPYGRARAVSGSAWFWGDRGLACNLQFGVWLIPILASKP